MGLGCCRSRRRVCDYTSPFTNFFGVEGGAFYPRVSTRDSCFDTKNL